MSQDTAVPAERELLDEVPETDASPWIADEEGDGFEIIVTELYDTPDSFNEDDTVPVVVGRDRLGESWSVAGYRTVLRKEIRSKDPQIGDLFAGKYLGTREIRHGKFAGKDTHVYRTRVVRAGDEAFAAYTAGYADPRLALPSGGDEDPAEKQLRAMEDGDHKEAKAAGKRDRAKASRAKADDEPPF